MDIGLIARDLIEKKEWDIIRAEGYVDGIQDLVRAMKEEAEREQARRGSRQQGSVTPITPEEDTGSSP